MPKIIQTTFEVLPEASVLIRSAYLRNDIRASSLVKEAQRRARDILAHSEERAESLFRDAKTEGYAAGVLAAAEVVVNYLAMHADIAAQLERTLQNKVELILQQCFSDVDVVMAVFEKSVDKNKRENLSKLEVVLPQGVKFQHRSILKQLQDYVGVDVHVEYHEESRFVFRYGDGVVEFSPDDFSRELRLHVMDDLPSAYAANRALAEKCRDRLMVLLAPDSQGLLPQSLIRTEMDGVHD